MDINSRRSPTQSASTSSGGGRKADAGSKSHKSMKQKLERLENTLSALPKALCEYMDTFSSFSETGVKLASLLETLFQETPILLIALRFREACETINDKCSKSGLFMKQEIVPPVKKVAPTLSKLRSQVESHAKVVAKHESYLKQLENMKASANPNRQKLEQVEHKFHQSAEDFAKEDSKLAEALNELYRTRVEVMGSCFLSFLETQSKLLTSVSEIMTPLGAYKELGKGLSDSLSNSVVKEATVGWLAAAQVNQNLRSFGNLTRIDVQCMMYNHSDGLPETIRSGLNSKVDDLLKRYAAELQKASNPHHKVTGGFHLNPKGIQLALRDCCSELEAMGAGAAHASSKIEKQDQINRDVPRICYKILDKEYGCAMGEFMDQNVQEKMDAILSLIRTLPYCSHQEVSEQIIEDFAFHILNESCTTVTNTAAKTAVQLVFGKANLVLVRPSPSPDDNQPVVLSARAPDSSIQINVRSSWWLVEDYAAFAMLSRTVDPTAVLGIVDVVYTINYTIQNFMNEDHAPTLPSIAVTYRQPPEQFNPSANRHHHQLQSQQQPHPRSPNTGLRDKDRLHTLNRSIRALLNVRRGPRSSNGHHHRASANLDKDSASTSVSNSKSPSFQSYLNLQHQEREREMEGENVSPRGSPQTRRRRPNPHRNEVEEDEDSIVPSEKLRTREQRGRNHTTTTTSAAMESTATSSTSNGPIRSSISDDRQTLDGPPRRGAGSSSAGSSSSDGGLPMDINGSSSGPHIHSSGGGGSSGSQGGGVPIRYTSSGGRSDSLTRGLKPSYGSGGVGGSGVAGGYPLRRYGSSESMSSQSTLVNRTGYEVEDDPQQSITDLIGMGRSGLTRSQINAHMRSEARKQRHGYPLERGGGGARGVASVGGDGGSRGGGARVRRGGDGHSGGGGEGERVVYYQRLHPELEYPYDEKLERRKQRRGRRHEVHGADTPDDEEDGPGDAHQMQVSPASDQQDVYIASEREVNNVIEFLSRSREFPPEGGPSKTDDFERDPQMVGDGRDYPYSSRSYDHFSNPDFSYHDRAWTRDGREHDRPSDAGDSSRSSSSGIGSEDRYSRGGGPSDNRRSRSSSASPGPEGRSREGKRDGSRTVASSSEGGEIPGRGDRKTTQELAGLDFSKGFGPLITEPHETFGMQMLRDSDDYKFSVELYKTMSDSDSEASGLSGRDSIPPISSSSSGSQSPMLIRTKSAENISTMERSSSRASTHSMPYTSGGGSVDLNDLMKDFDHTPGSRLPNRHPGRAYSEYDYDDRLSQGSLDGSGRGSLSQGSHEWMPQDWGRPEPPPPRGHYGRRFDFEGPPPPRGGGIPPYDGPERQARALERTPRSREDYSPSPGPSPFEHRHPIVTPPPPGNSGYWAGGRPPGGPPGAGGNYDLPFDSPPRMRMGPPPPHPPVSGPGMMHPHQGPPLNSGPPPPHIPPPGHGPMPPPPHHHDRGFRPVPFRPNTPSDAPSPASLPSMSPGPSPHPTPPPTPPPPNPNLMGPPHHPSPHGPPPHSHAPPPPIPGPPHMHGGNQGPPMGGPMGHGPPPMGHPGGPPPPHHMGPPRPPPPGPSSGPPHQRAPPPPRGGGGGGGGPPWDGHGPPPPHGPRDFPPPRNMPPPPPHMGGHAPSPGPPPPHHPPPGGRYPNHIPEWERNWKPY